ncbi:MAG: hypothetical protein HY821_25485 [Acidobacteria bacterium]|nr:hypothetical protein [Acidobacteriota bacterium]
MASYRDRRQPELLRFPGDLRPKILICCALFVNLLCALVSLAITSPWQIRAFDFLILGVVSFLEIRAWPREITLDPGGIQLLNLLGKPLRSIAWHEITAMEESHEFGGALARALGLTTDTLVVRTADPFHSIVHTSRHPDRDRLLREYRQQQKSAAARHAPPATHP